MTLTTRTTDLARSPGDPKVLTSGPSSRGTADTMVKRLGWFSLALGVTELVAARPLTRALGIEGREGLVRAFGTREIAAGMACLSTRGTAGVWSRVGGDALDIAALLYALRGSRKQGSVGLALAAVAGVTLVDIATALALTSRHGRKGQTRDYRDRSGWPGGAARSRGAAADFPVPRDMRGGIEAAAGGVSPAPVAAPADG
ncbi:MAG: hypothetical protein ABW194_10560 [Novosphingobium sp.]